jgi:glycosyltransferase involved in cell wall biosynthesis
MRILLVTNYQPPHMGGIEFAGRELKYCWQQDGHEVTWLTTDLPRGGRPSTDDNVRVPALNFAEEWWQINTPLVMPASYRAIKTLIADHDVINTHSLAPGLASLTASLGLRIGKPVVVTQHVGIIPLRFHILSTLQEKIICRNAERTVRHGGKLTFVGAAVRDWFDAHTALGERELIMTPAGINPDVYHYVSREDRVEFREKWNIPSSTLSVLFVGRFYEKKGLDLIEQAARHAPHVHFSLRGSGPIDPASWNLPNVRLLPFVSDEELRELYGAHDMFILPSVGEGWPAVVPQAMACGLPCLISEETFDGYGKDPERFVVCSRHADTISRKLELAAAGQLPLLSTRKELADYAVEQWNWKRTARIYVQLFQELLDAPAG